MKLKSIRVQNLLGIESADLTFGDKMTLIYGPNGAGKTSLADAIRWALTGDAARGWTLGEMVRRGSKSAEVELQLGDINIIRRQTRSGGAERAIDGVDVSADECSVSILDATKLKPAVIDAALRAGAILEMKPVELQKMMLALCGGKAEAEAITAALGPEVTAAAARVGIPLPTTLDAFATICASAESARREAKRALAEAEGDLARKQRPSGPAGDAAWAVRNTGGKKVLIERVAELEALLEKALLAKAAGDGARAEKLRTMRARITELAAIEKPKGDAESMLAKLKGLKESALAAKVRQGAAGERLAQLRTKLAELKAAAGDAAPATDPEAAAVAARAFDAAEATDAQHKAALADHKAAGTAAAAKVEEAKVEGCTHGCPVHCPDLAEADARLKAAKDTYAKVAKSAKVAAAALAAAKDELAARRRADYAAAAVAVEKNIAELQPEADGESRSTAIADDFAKLEKLVADHSAYAKAQAESKRLAEEVARLTDAPVLTVVPAASDAEGLRASLAIVKASCEAWDAFERITEGEAKVAKLGTRVADTDTVAQATGPKGAAKVKLLASVLAPFLAVANEAFGILLPGVEVAFITDGELRIAFKDRGELYPAEAISEGQRSIFRYALQFAVAKLAKVDVLILDHAEAVDERGRAAVKKLVNACAKQGLQVVLLSCSPAPAAAPKGVPVYLFASGHASAVGGAT